MNTPITINANQPEITDLHNARSENDAGFKLVEYYCNNTDEDVTITRRNNLGVRIARPGNTNSIHKAVIIRRNYRFNGREAITSTIDNINEYYKSYNNNHRELFLIKEILEKNLKNNFHCRFIDATLDYVISADYIKRHKAIYESELDLVISLGGYSTEHPHPFSVEGQGIEQYQDFVRNKRGSGLFVEIIDNDGLIKNRFIYIGKQMVQIPVIEDPYKESGVYYSFLQGNRLDDPKIMPKKIDIDEAEEVLGVYRTQEEARSGGDAKLISEQELTLLNKELTEQKKQLAQFEHEIEQKKKDNIKLKEELETEKLKRDNYNALIKDHYEHESYKRKNTHETLKICGGIVAGALAAFAFLRKR